MLFGGFDNVVGPCCPELPLRGSQTRGLCLQQYASYLQHFAKGRASFLTLYYLSLVSGASLYRCNILFRSTDKSEVLTSAAAPWLPVQILYTFYQGSRTHTAQFIYNNSRVGPMCGWLTEDTQYEGRPRRSRSPFSKLSCLPYWALLPVHGVFILNPTIFEGMFLGLGGCYQDDEILCLLCMDPGCMHRGSQLTLQTG